MEEKKLVSKKRLKEFHDSLIQLYSSLSFDNKMRENLLCLIEFYEKFILEKDKQELNELKKQVYFDMKNACDKDSNKKLYDLYQLLKQIQ